MPSARGDARLCAQTRVADYRAPLERQLRTVRVMNQAGTFAAVEAAASRRSVFVEEAAALLGVSRRTVYTRIREGKLHTIRTRGGSQRVLVDSIESLLREQAERRRPRASEPEALAFQV